MSVGDHGCPMIGMSNEYSILGRPTLSRMPYVEGRTIHDADSHIVETPDWFFGYADPAVRERLEPLYVSTVKPGEADFIEDYRKRHADPAFRAEDEQQIMLRKNWTATGSFIKDDRPRALDLLGFASQLVFNTFSNKMLQRVEHSGDVDYAYGIATAHNRAIVDFCSADRRLLAVGYLPLADFDRAQAAAREAIELGCKTVMVAPALPPGHPPRHHPHHRVAGQAGG